MKSVLKILLCEIVVVIFLGVLIKTTDFGHSDYGAQVSLALIFIPIVIVLVRSENNKFFKKYNVNVKDIHVGHLNDYRNQMNEIDNMDGHEFELFCAALLRKNGFSNVKVTQVSGDQGVDIIAKKDGLKYAIQCKRYSSDLGNTPIQEVFAGKNIYNCQVAVVMTNRHFTKGGTDLAKATGVLLWDREKLYELMRNA